MNRLSGIVVLCLLIGIGAIQAVPPAARTAPAYGDHVVEISVTYQSFDEDRPWSKVNPQVRTGMAVVVDGPFLLTTAQMVRYATLIEVDKHGASGSTEARLVHVDPEIDLALLSISDTSFWADLRPVKLAGEVPTEGTVSSVRWNNNQLEVSASRVGRLQVEDSWMGSFRYPVLLLTTDFEGGGWSEPVFNDGLFLGLTISMDGKKSRVLPIDLIAPYLKMSRDPASYRGFTRLGLMVQANEDPAQAAFLGLTGKPRGLMIRQIPSGSPAEGILKPGDLILNIDGHAIDGAGFYQHPRYGRLSYAGIIGLHTVGEILKVEVLRDKKTLTMDLPLRPFPASAQLIPLRRYDQPPPFLITGGLVFREFDVEYLRTWGNEYMNKAPQSLVSVYFLEDALQTPSRKKVVLLQGVLPDDFNIGYQDLADDILTDVNGRPVDSIVSLEEALRHPVDGFHVFHFRQLGNRGEVVLDAAALDTATERILKAYRIPLGKRVPTDR